MLSANIDLTDDSDSLNSNGVSFCRVNARVWWHVSWRQPPIC